MSVPSSAVTLTILETTSISLTAPSTTREAYVYSACDFSFVSLLNQAQVRIQVEEGIVMKDFQLSKGEVPGVGDSHGSHGDVKIDVI